VIGMSSPPPSNPARRRSRRGKRRLVTATYIIVDPKNWTTG
jgi:hypothetical protein